MNEPRKPDMVQVHLLTTYPAALLNRDDAGLAKRIPFGGKTRIRVSSQCLKKHWREADTIQAHGDQAERSIRIYEKEVAGRLQKEQQAAGGEATAIARYLMSVTVDTKPDEEKYGAGTTRAKQLLVLTRAEIDWLYTLGTDMLKRIKDQAEAKGSSSFPDPDDEQEVKQFHEALIETLRERGILGSLGINAKSEDLESKKKRETLLNKIKAGYTRTLQASVDTAMFGRMVTSDLFARVDAAVSVAHAFTTHAAEPETDFFTAVDTLKEDEDDAGAGTIQETELTTGVFYTYAVLDMNQLRDNLGAKERTDEAESLARDLVRTMAMIGPTAKRGSTAPFSRAEFILLERGDQQPRTLGNAFLEPVRENGAGTMQASIEKLTKCRTAMEAMYDEKFANTATVSSSHNAPAMEGVEQLSFRDALATVFPGTE